MRLGACAARLVSSTAIKAAAATVLTSLLGACMSTTTLSPAAAAAASAPTLQQQVAQTEQAFAKTMTARDHAAFTRFLSDEAQFFGNTTVLRGKGAVAAGWKPFFDGASPPFTWAPDAVSVLDSGTLALSSGPVFDPAGNRISTFTSIWRLEAPGVWRIIFDKGCSCAGP